MAYPARSLTRRDLALFISAAVVSAAALFAVTGMMAPGVTGLSISGDDMGSALQNALIGGAVAFSALIVMLRLGYVQNALG